MLGDVFPCPMPRELPVLRLRRSANCYHRTAASEACVVGKAESHAKYPYLPKEYQLMAVNSQKARWCL